MAGKHYLMISIALAAVAVGAGRASATKLDDATCDGLKAERARIETEALKSDMGKGPAWAKANLSSDRLKEIEQLIGLQENIAFRCPLPKPPPPVQGATNTAKPSKSNSDGAADGNDGKSTVKAPKAGGETQKNSSKSPSSDTKPSDAAKSDQLKKASQKKQPVQQAAPKPVKPEGNIGVDNLVLEEAPAPPVAKPVSKKPKVSDAYVPPPRLGDLPGDNDQPVFQSGQQAGSKAPPVASGDGETMTVPSLAP